MTPADRDADDTPLIRIGVDTDPHSDAFVLHRRPLREGSTLEHTSRFDDDVWSLQAAVLQVHQKPLSLNFDLLPAQHRLLAKHLFYAMLSGPLPAAEQRPSISGVRQTLTELKRFFTWLHDRAPDRRPHELAGPDLIAYQHHLLATLPTATARGSARAAVRRLWRWRDALKPAGGGLPFDPRHLRGWGEPDNAAPAENSTDRIPEPVLGPLISWALLFVDEFAPDILAADQHNWQIRHRARVRRMSPDKVDAQLERTIADYRLRGVPLPGWEGRVNIGFLAPLVGCSHSALETRTEILDAAAAELGVGEFSEFHTPITGRLDGQPWIEGIASAHKAHHSLGRLARHLQIACYILIAFLSGMRDSEIKHLRRGCLHPHHDAVGGIRRWTVTSRAFKGERDPAGVEATWVIGAPAARAVAVLEQLQPADVDWLFAVLGHGPGTGPASVSSNLTMSSTATNDRLNTFRTWVNEHAARHSHSGVIPTVDGQPWRLTSGQFRRTLAWFIARRPGGAIAGAIAYRHHCVQMFEGYAGTSDSGFRAEVESEQALARGEHLLAMIDRHEHKTLAGPAADEAARRLDDLDANAHFTGTVITDPRRLKRLLDRADPAVHPGDYVTCVFDPDKALCLRGTDASAPLLRQCRPLDCRNVALTDANLQAWHEEITAIEHRLDSRPALPPLLINRLRSRHEQITVFLARNDDPSTRRR